MPLVTVDIIKGRDPQQIQALLDSIHRAVVDSFGVPERDRYQIVNERAQTHMIVEDTGLDIPRTRDVVVISVRSRERTLEAKVEFYRSLSVLLEENCGVSPSDLMVSIVTNSDADWSFGFGRAQFLTGEL